MAVKNNTAYPTTSLDTLGTQARNGIGQLNDYSALMTTATPQGWDPTKAYDPYNAAPVATGSGGMYQQTNADGSRTQGLVPGTLYGGLLDTRYTGNMVLPPAPGSPGIAGAGGTSTAGASGLGGAAAPATVNHLDSELSYGIPDNQREQNYDLLRTAEGNISANIANLQQRADKATAKGHPVSANVAAGLADKQPVEDYFQNALGNYLQTQQLPDTTSTAFDNAFRESEASRRKNKQVKNS